MANIPVPQICAGLPAHTALQSDSVALRAGLTVIIISQLSENTEEKPTGVTTVALESLVTMVSLWYWMAYLNIIFSSKVIITSTVLGTHL
jgi:hypothetical protein